MQKLEMTIQAENELWIYEKKIPLNCCNRNYLTYFCYLRFSNKFKFGRDKEDSQIDHMKKNS